MANNYLDALLETSRAAARTLWRRRMLALGVAWGIALLGAAIIPFVPQRYEASARLYVDTQSVLKPLMAGLAFEPDIDLQLRMLSRTIISRPNVEKMLARPELQLDSLTAEGKEKAVSQLMDRIKLTPGDTGNLYTVSYRDVDRDRAQRVVGAIVELFVGASARDKRRDSQEASQFIENQIQVNEAKLIEAENRLKEFKLRHFGVSGVSNQDYFARISVISDGLEKLRSDLRAAEQSRDSFRRELSAEDPQLPIATEVDKNIANLKRQLAELLTRYTDRHPDVIGLRQQIAELQGQKRDDAAGDKGRGVVATSPVYQRLRVSLVEAEAVVGSLRSRVAAEQQRLDEVRSMASRIPQVEAELAQLNRDYDIIHKNYEQLVVRRESASLGLKIDESTQMADFQLVEPPRVSPTPVFPSRMNLAVLVVAGSIVCGLLAPALAAAIRPTFESANALRVVSGRPVLGTISVSAPIGRNVQGATLTAGLALALVALLVLQGAWLAWIATRPLV